MRQFFTSFTTLFLFFSSSSLCGEVAAFQQLNALISNNHPEVTSISSTSSLSASNFGAVVRTTAAASLAVLLTVGTCSPLAPAFASTVTTSNSAVQVYLDQIPPSTISIQVSDLPIVGNLVSGTYAKVDSKTSDSKNAPPSSVVIKSPKDKAKAIQGATNGHLELDIAGKVGIKTHLDVDVAADEAGIAKVRIASDLIPPLPFKNLASSSKGGKESQWNAVTNMGNGETYYFNTKTAETQYEKPDKI